MVAALYVMADGPYAGRADVDLWDAARDARGYPGPFPVVAHPPCARWGRFFWKDGSTVPGNDGGLFAHALSMVHCYGGVLEHPAASAAWSAFDLPVPPKEGDWIRHALSLVARPSGWSCHVEQGQYGHPAPKPTWLYCSAPTRPPPTPLGTSGIRPRRHPRAWREPAEPLHAAVETEAHAYAARLCGRPSRPRPSLGGA